MLFNSIDFAIFLPIVLILYWTLRRRDLQNALLVASSYVFYGWWDYRFLSLIAFSSVVDYVVGLGLARSNKRFVRRALLFISLATNLGLLGLFKYYAFFVESFSRAFTLFGYELGHGSLSVVLPVGISFYTFQTLSYSIDVYQRRLEPSRDLVAFFAFVSFFPQLVAGPIERASNLLPQFSNERRIEVNDVTLGVKSIIYGLFLKLVVADRAAIYVNTVFNNVEEHQGLTFVAATIFFAFQIYGDFAGYSLIAVGTAMLLGIRLMTNFNRPYLSGSVSEFWGRWHISLSTWFRDYVYIPLGGNRASKPRWLFNLFATFVLSGLWHGADWKFVVWGALNGLYLIAETLLNARRRKGPVHIAVTFALICLAWVFFRANSIDDALHVLGAITTMPGKLFVGRGHDVTTPIYALFGILVVCVNEVIVEMPRNEAKSSVPRGGALVYATISFLVLFLGVFGKSQFIYFQF